jgi:hypothetical protein
MGICEETGMDPDDVWSGIIEGIDKGYFEADFKDGKYTYRLTKAGKEYAENLIKQGVQ